jgi:hypothetical protein
VSRLKVRCLSQDVPDKLASMELSAAKSLKFP